jgi:hypothetical protein
MLLAATALLALLDQIEQAASAEPPLFQVETLLQAADALTDPTHRRRFLDGALGAMGGLRHEPSRYTYQAAAAKLMSRDDFEGAARLCRQIPAAQEAKSRCWKFLIESSHSQEHRHLYEEALQDGAYLLPSIVKFVDTRLMSLLMASFPRRNPSYEDVQLLQRCAKAVAGWNPALAEEALALLPEKLPDAPKRTPPKPAPVNDALPIVKPLMDRADDESATDAERSRLFRRVLDISDDIANLTERMMHQGAIAAWYASHGEEAVAARAAAMLHKTFELACRCEDIQCDSLPDREDCSDSIDTFAAFLLDNKVDYTSLRIRHPSLAARTLIVKLKEALKK